MNRLEKLSLVGAARIIVLVIGLLLLLFFGIDTLFRTQYYTYIPWFPTNWVALSGMKDIPLLVLGSLGLLVPIFYMAIAAVQSRLEKGIVGKGTDGDDICLTPSAIERAVVRGVRQDVVEVRKVRGCSATQGTRGVKLTIRIAVDEGSPVTVVRSKVKSSIVTTLERVIGYRQGAQIRVKVTDVIPTGAGKNGNGNGKKKKSRKKEAAAQA